MTDSAPKLQCNADINSNDPWEGPEKTTLVNAYFWFDGVTRCVISSIGIIGNFITIILFSSKDLRSTFHMLLVVLAGVDMGYLFLTLLEEIPQMQDILNQGTTYPDPKCVLNKVWVLLYPHLIRPFQFVFITAAEYLTIIICLDRYIAIKYPLRHYSPWNLSTFDNNSDDKRKNHKNKNIKHGNNGMGITDWRHVIGYSVLVMFISVIYCIPVFFEYESVPATDYRNATVNETIYGQSEVYIIGYFIVADCIFRFILPVGVLSFTNISIHRIVSKHPMKQNDQAAYQKRVQNVMLFGVVIVLILVHSYRLVLNVKQLFLLETLKICGKDFGNQIAHMVARVLMTLNCSVNCFVYIAASKKFRTVAFKYFSAKNEDEFHPNICNDNIPQHPRRQRKLTPITPFGSGYVSWGTRGPSSENVKVVVSKKNSKKEEVMKVSVITGELSF